MQDGDEDNLLEAEILSFLSSHYTSTTFPASVARDQEDIVRHMMQVLRKVCYTTARIMHKAFLC